MEMSFEIVVGSLLQEGLAYVTSCIEDGIGSLCFWWQGIVSEVGSDRNHKSVHVLSRTRSLEA